MLEFILFHIAFTQYFITYLYVISHFAQQNISFKFIPQNNYRPCHPERRKGHSVTFSQSKSEHREDQTMQSIVWDLGRLLFLLVDPVLRTPLRGSTPLRSAQDDTRGLCSHEFVGTGVLDGPIYNKILFF